MLSAFLDNLSFGGFGMYSQDKVDLKKEIEFDLTVPLLGQPLSGSGSIRYMNPVEKYNKEIYFMGVEFGEVNKDAIVFIIKRLHLQKSKQTAAKIHNYLDFIPY